MAVMRVMHLIKGLGRGGAEMLLPSLIRSGGPEFKFSVGYFLPWKDALVPDLEGKGVPVERFTARGPAGMLARVPGIARFLRRHRVDLVHAHLPLAGVVARLAGRMAGVPVVYTEHNLQERYHPLTRTLNSTTWGLQSAAVAVSAEVEESARRQNGSAVPIYLVRNGIEIPHACCAGTSRERVRGEFEIGPDDPVVGTVAVFRTQKRLDRWLEAAAEIRQRVPDVHFLMVGDGPVRPELDEVAGSLGLSDRVHFAGLADDVPPYLAAMDVYLMSSEFEGLPLALLEAMAAGLPVAATSVGGIPEVIDSDAAGLLVEPGDVAGLAAATVRLLTDRAVAEAIGVTGREVVEERFGVERMARELEDIYLKVASPPRVR